jgi:hypothetical protein
LGEVNTFWSARTPGRFLIVRFDKTRSYFSYLSRHFGHMSVRRHGTAQD